MWQRPSMYSTPGRCGELAGVPADARHGMPSPSGIRLCLLTLVMKCRVPAEFGWSYWRSSRNAEFQRNLVVPADALSKRMRSSPGEAIPAFLAAAVVIASVRSSNRSPPGSAAGVSPIPACGVASLSRSGLAPALVVPSVHVGPALAVQPGCPSHPGRLGVVNLGGGAEDHEVPRLRSSRWRVRAKAEFLEFRSSLQPPSRRHLGDPC